MYSSCAAFSGLYIDGRLAGGDLECVAGDADDDTKCRSGETLSVGAMADGGRFRVSLGLVSDVTAVAAPSIFMTEILPRSGSGDEPTGRRPRDIGNTKDRLRAGLD